LDDDPFAYQAGSESDDYDFPELNLPTLDNESEDLSGSDSGSRASSGMAELVRKGCPTCLKAEEVKRQARNRRHSF
jgi:hypothetical protein